MAEIIKDYDCIAFDAQYFLFRNNAALQSRTCMPTATALDDCEGDSSIGYVINKYDYTYQSLVKQFFWTIGKFIRDKYTTNKVILLWDEPPYHKTKLLPDFKSSRIHHCQATLDNWDIEHDPEGYLQEKENYRCHLIMQQAKYWIINNLSKLGINSVIIPGFEADDLAYVFSNVWKDNQIGLRSAICSADSDWMYWIGDNTDFISFNKAEVWNRDDINKDWDGMLDKLNISPFELKKWADSTFYSHNDLQRTSSIRWTELPRLYSEVNNGNYDLINDIERFKLNMRSFDIDDYPNYADAVTRLTEVISMDSDNLIKDKWSEYENLKKDGFQISSSYLDTFWTNLTRNID